MAKNKNDLMDSGGDWGDDDDFDMGSFDLGDDNLNANRSATWKIQNGLRQGAISKAGGGNLAKGLLFATLPKSYENAFTEVGRVKSELDSIYSSLKKDADPVIRSLKSVAGTFSPITNFILPKKLASKLLSDDGYDPGYGSESSSDNQEDSEVASAISGVFGAVAAQNDSQHREQLAHTNYDREIGKKQFEYSAQHQGSQSELLSRLVGYQDSVLNVYHKKSLELQYRQHYSLKSLLNVTVETAKASIEELRAIAKFTSLPNEVKVTDSEILKNRTKHLLIGKVQEKFHGGASAFLHKFRKGAMSEIQDFLGGVGNALNTAETFGGMSSGMGDTTTMLSSGLGEELMGGAGRLAGNIWGTKVRNAIDHHAPGFNNGVISLGNKAARIQQQWPAMIMDYLREGNGQGWRGVGHRIMNDEGSGTTDIIKHDLANEAHEQTSWDALSRRTLIDIIPGYMSRQLQTQDSIYNILTGNPDRADRIVYSVDAERFITHKERIKRTKLQLKQTLNAGSIKDETSKLVGHIDDGTLTDEEKHILGLFMAKEADKSSAFSVKKYSDEMELPAEIAERVAPMIRKAFGIEETEDLDDFGRRKFKVIDSPESTDRHTKAATAFGNLGRSFTNMDSVLGSKHNLGETEDLFDLGVVNDKGANSEYKWGMTDKLLRSKNREDFYKDYENVAPTKAEILEVLANMNRGKKGKKKKTVESDSLTQRLMGMLSSSDDSPSLGMSGGMPTEIKVDFKDDSNRIIEAITNNTTLVKEYLERIAIGVESIESVGDSSAFGPIQPLYDKHRDKIDSAKGAIKWGADKALSGAKGVLTVGKGALSVTGKFGKFLYNHTPDGPQLKSVGEQIVILSKKGFSVAKLAGIYGMKAVRLALSGGKFAAIEGALPGAKWAGGKVSSVFTRAKDYLGEHGVLDGGKKLLKKHGHLALMAAGGALAMRAGGAGALALGALGIHTYMNNDKKGGLFRSLKAVYTKGKRGVPALGIEGLLHGEYIDKLTGAVITSAKDITGAVVNKYGETVITTKEFLDGLVDEEGKPFSESVKDQAMKLKKLLTKGNLKKVFTKENLARAMKAKKWLTDSSPAARLKKMWTKTHVQKDLTTHVGGDPIIKAETMKLGLYVDGHTGKVINSIYQIIGSVKEIVGTDMIEVLSDLDVKNGLYDCITGKKIKLKRLSKLAMSKITGLVGKGIKGITGSGVWQKLTKLKTPVQGIASAVIDKLADTMVNKDNKVEELLTKIYDFLKEAMPVEDSETREANRPGGAMDQMRHKPGGGLILPAERGSKGKAAAAGVGASAAGAGLIAGGAPSVMPPGHDEPEDEEKESGGTMDTMAKWGGYGAGGLAAIKGALGYLGFGGTAAETGLAVEGVGAAGGAGAMAVAAPLLALGGGLALMKSAFDDVHARRMKAEGREAELIGESAMPSTFDNMKDKYVNAKYKSTLSSLEKLRYLQYGIPIDNEKAVKTLRYFESEMLDIISIPDNKPPNIGSSIDDIWNDYGRVFNNNPADTNAKKSFSVWFMKRFVPVYVKHTLAARKWKRKLDKVDELPNLKAQSEFVNLVQFDGDARKMGLDPFSVQSSPFSNIPLTDNIGLADTLSNQLRDPSKIKYDILGNTEDIKDPKDIQGQAAKLAEEAKQKDIEDKAKDPSIIDKAKGIISDAASSVGSGIDWLRDKTSRGIENVANAGSSVIDTVKNIVGDGFGGGADTEKSDFVISSFMKLGWSKEQAAGITANLKEESQFNPDSKGDGGNAYGIGQWHSDRQENFRKFIGKDIHGSTLEEQIRFVDWELKNTEKGAGDKLSETTTASDAGAVVSKLYERPAAIEEAARNRAKLANGLFDSYNGANGSKNFVSALGNYVKGGNGKGVTSSDCDKKYGDPNAKNNIINWNIPSDLRIKPFPNSLECNKDLVGPLSQAFKNIISRNLTNQIKTFDGCLCIRKKRGGNTMSLHSWGIALDINAATNGFGAPPTMSHELVACFTDSGFDWGGNWSKPDGMHFQLSSLNGASAPAGFVVPNEKSISDTTSTTSVQSPTDTSSSQQAAPSTTQTSPMKSFSMDDSSSGGAQPIGAMSATSTANTTPSTQTETATTTPVSNVGAIGGTASPMISSDVTSAENNLLGIKTQPIMTPATPSGPDVASVVESTATTAEKQRTMQQQTLESINNTLQLMVKNSATPGEAMAEAARNTLQPKSPYQSTTKPVTPMVDMSM